MFGLSIYPTFLCKNTEGEKDLRNMGVPPNSTFGYIWKLTNDDGPLDGDPQCLTQLYQSTVSPERDLASGLVGTLLICKYEAIDTKGNLVRISTLDTLEKNLCQLKSHDIPFCPYTAESR